MASSQPQSEKVVPWSASRASWLPIKDEGELEDDDKQALERMKQADDKVAMAHVLGRRLVQMVRERQSEALLPWLEDATKSRIEVLRQFVYGRANFDLLRKRVIGGAAIWDPD